MAVGAYISAAADAIAQHPPVLHCFGHMCGLGRGAAGQVGNRACHAQGAVGGACRPSQAGGSRLQEAGGGGRQGQVGIELLALQAVVGAVLACQGPRPCLRNPGAHGAAALAAAVLQQLGRWQGRYFDVQVDAVEQRAAQLALVARNLLGRTAAGPLWAAGKAARTGVHGGDELKAGRELGALRGAGDGDAARFQRFAQGFEGAAGKLRKFVEEQHALVGERDFTRPGRRAAVR